MKRLMLVLLVCSFGLQSCGSISCTEPPESHKGAELTGCSTSGEVTCCSYTGDSCSYTLCADSCNDEYTQSSWSCY
jgi:hypothetical protein